MVSTSVLRLKLGPAMHMSGNEDLPPNKSLERADFSATPFELRSKIAPQIKR